VVLASDGEEALRLVTPEVTALAVDLVVPLRNGLDVIQEVRQRRPELAILAFTAGAPPSEAVAAMVAGADHYLDFEGPEGVEPALELAIDRRLLSRFIERTEAELEQARSRLFQLGGALPPGLPGFRPPLTGTAVVPFNEAARFYLLACAKLYTGDPRGLAQRLGISYFALRRLLKRYDVPFPGRSRTRASSER
jgi:CheY-like chemotaxis protein